MDSLVEGDLCEGGETDEEMKRKNSHIITV